MKKNIGTAFDGDSDGMYKTIQTSIDSDGNVTLSLELKGDHYFGAMCYATFTQRDWRVLINNIVNDKESMKKMEIEQNE